MASNNKSISPKVKGEERTYKITDLKFNVVTPVNMSCILEPVELAIFIALIHHCNTSNKPISLSIIASFTGLTKSRVSGNIQNLVQLGLIRNGRKTQLGTFYYIETEKIVKFLTDFNEIKDPVLRLQIADLIRVCSGLEPKNKSAIKLFPGHEETGVNYTDFCLVKSDVATFNHGIVFLNEFQNLKGNNIWLKIGVKMFILDCLVERLIGISKIVSIELEYNEQKGEYYGKAK